MRGQGSVPRIVAIVALCGLGLPATDGGATPSGVPVSSVIYPPVERRTLRFSHARHRDQGCVDCHRSVKGSVSAADRNLPTEEACRRCHAQTRGEGKPRDRKRCATCHVGYTGEGSPARMIYPPANLRFGHRLHLERGTGCASCHRHEGRGRSLPTMASCLACHRSSGVSDRCVVCHLAEKDGRLRTRFPSGQLRPRGSLKGDAHTQDFERRHGQLARGNRRYCESCHRPQGQSCLRCHAGSLRPMRIHSGDYVTRHAMDARRNEPRCESCHRSQTFCLGCHQRLGVGQETPGGGFRPSTGARFHPPAFVAMTVGAGHHSYSARRNIRSCSSCHRERTCIRCHGTRGLGRGGFSPHPAGFGASARCRSISARNQRVCLKCHTPDDRRIRCN